MYGTLFAVSRRYFTLFRASEWRKNATAADCGLGPGTVVRVAAEVLLHGTGGTAGPDQRGDGRLWRRQRRAH